MTAPWPAVVGRSVLSPVPAPRRAEMLARRQPLRRKERARRPDELRYRASPSPAALRRVTLQRACRVVTPSAGQGPPARPGRRIRRPAPWAGPRPRRSTQTRPGLRPILPAVRSQVPADPPLVRPARARLQPLLLQPAPRGGGAAP